MTIPHAVPFFSLAANFAVGKDTPRDVVERYLVCLQTFEPALCRHDIVATRAAAEGMATLAPLAMGNRF
jgi:hypothetical protein